MGIVLCLPVFGPYYMVKDIFFSVMKTSGASLSLKTPSQEKNWFVYPKRIKAVVSFTQLLLKLGALFGFCFQN